VNAFSSEYTQVYCKSTVTSYIVILSDLLNRCQRVYNAIQWFSTFFIGTDPFRGVYIACGPSCSDTTVYSKWTKTSFSYN